MNYPNGKKPNTQNRQTAKPTKPDFSNRGMTLEEDINVTNDYYLQAGIAVIHKKPTPVQIVDVSYPKRSAAVIKEAYFKQASTTDYNGIYKGKHIDFEAKETNKKTSFPLNNIHQHQIDHMRAVNQHGGITFIILKFTPLDEVFLFPFKSLDQWWRDQWNGGRKSIPYAAVKEDGVLVPFHFQARIDYVKALDKLYF